MSDRVGLLEKSEAMHQTKQDGQFDVLVRDLQKEREINTRQDAEIRSLRELVFEQRQQLRLVMWLLVLTAGTTITYFMGQLLKVIAP
jgi:hypothetical protein